MKVRSLEAIPIGLPFRRPYVTASGSLERRDMILVRITGDDAVGHGDAVPMGLRGGPSLDAVRHDLETACAPALADSPLGGDPRTAIRRALDGCRAAGAGPEALSAVDTALVDLIGRREGIPAWRLLGAGRCEPVRCNGSIGADDPTSAAADAAALAGVGFETLKVKVGRGDDLERMRAVRAAVGPALKLRVDANGAWGAQEAITRLTDIAELGLELAEQPCRRLEELAEVRSATGIRIVADESVATLGEALEALAAGAMDAATLKLTKVGGVHAAIEIAAATPAYLSSALDSAVGIAAAAHCVQAMFPRQFAAGLAHGLATSSLFADDVADAAHLKGPVIELGEEPGLGIEVDPDAVERLRLR